MSERKHVVPRVVLLAVVWLVSACGSGGSGTLLLDTSEGSDADVTAMDTSEADTGGGDATTSSDGTLDVTEPADVRTDTEADTTDTAADAGGDVEPDMTDPDMAPGCVSNSQCPAPTSICDTVLGTCVECLVFSDCAVKPGTVCDAGVCACPDAGEDWCPGVDTCVDVQTSSDHCGRCGSGCLGDGACAVGECVDGLREVTDAGAPEGPRYLHISAWTGDAMFVWGGRAFGDGTYLTTGGLYDPVANSWSPASQIGAPPGREGTHAVWTGTEVLVWGGFANNNFDLANAAYNPATNTWRPISENGAPSPRAYHGVAWTGSEMIVWGGISDTVRFGEGAAYDPAADTWRTLPSDASSFRREALTADWIDNSLHVFGGFGDDDSAALANIAFAGHRVLRGDTWADGQTIGAPSPRYLHSATVFGSASDQLFVWGGLTDSGSVANGGVWDTTTNAWSALPTLDAPSARRQASALWVEGAGVVVVLGGVGGASLFDDGAVWNPSTDMWTPLPSGLPPSSEGSAVSAGDEVIVWGLTGGAIIAP